MTVGELHAALLPYPPGLPVIVIISPTEEKSYAIRSVDEIRDTETGQRYVIIACSEESK